MTNGTEDATPQMTPAEQALTSLANSLQLVCCEHLYKDGAVPALIACIRCELPKLVAAVRPHIAAETLRQFADAHRFPSDWIMFRRHDGSGVTVHDLLHETADRIEKDGGPL